MRKISHVAACPWWLQGSGEAPEWYLKVLTSPGMTVMYSEGPDFHALCNSVLTEDFMLILEV